MKKIINYIKFLSKERIKAMIYIALGGMVAILGLIFVIKKLKK